MKGVRNGAVHPGFRRFVAHPPVAAAPRGAYDAGPLALGMTLRPLRGAVFTVALPSTQKSM